MNNETKKIVLFAIYIVRITAQQNEKNFKKEAYVAPVNYWTG